jgi:hypothetical protein
LSRGRSTVFVLAPDPSVPTLTPGRSNALILASDPARSSTLKEGR